MSKLTENNFNFDKEENCHTFHLHKTQKVHNTAIIPCFDDDVVKIFESYDKKFPVFMAEQTFNDAIKAVCKAAGLTKTVEQIRLHPEGGEDIKTTSQLYECITHRTFRKTFASNLIRHYKIPMPVAMYYTTHDTEKSFKAYIRITKKEWLTLGVEAMKYMNDHIKMKVVA
jgi:hypothetical protein